MRPLLLQQESDMTATASENAYDQVPYPNWTHRDTHPRQLEAIATLFGMHPAPSPRAGSSSSAARRAGI